jgi:hypothetical protein
VSIGWFRVEMDTSLKDRAIRLTDSNFHFVLCGILKSCDFLEEKTWVSAKKKIRYDHLTKNSRLRTRPDGNQVKTIRGLIPRRIAEIEDVGLLMI